MLSAVLFDENRHFAGFKFVNPKTKESFIDTPLASAQLTAEPMDSRMTMDLSEHTRIIGFRTTKECETAKQIMSIQPIYFSLDEGICSRVLKPLQSGHLEEVGGYGPTCAETTAQMALMAMEQEHEREEEEEA